jgi:hypothetical protein
MPDGARRKARANRRIGSGQRRPRASTSMSDISLLVIPKESFFVIPSEAFLVIPSEAFLVIPSEARDLASDDA